MNGPELVEISLLVYLLVEKRMNKRLKDLHIFRNEVAGMSHGFLVVKLKVAATPSIWEERVLGIQ